MTMSFAHILVVDDEATTLHGLEALLRLEGATVACATNAMAALEQAQRERFDVVLSDIALPKMTGLELCARLRELSPETPVIVMSGYRLDDDVVGRVGAVEAMTKPVEFDALLCAIQRALDGRGEGHARQFRWQDGGSAPPRREVACRPLRSLAN